MIASVSVISLFDERAEQYDRWFDEHNRAYQAELNALRWHVPEAGLGIEVGAGTGRFSVPLGVAVGVEPAERMASIARSRGLAVVRAMGEHLPFRDETFDYVLLVTVVCFVTDPPALLREAGRVLSPAGRLIVGMIDGQSALGRLYQARRETDPFYREASFHSVADVASWVRQAGFGRLRYSQTLSGPPGEDTTETYRITDGYGEGAFVAMSAIKEQGKNSDENSACH